MATTAQTIAEIQAKKARKIKYRQKKRVFEHMIGDAKPGSIDRHVVFSKQDGDGEQYLHATKGWRSRRGTA